MLKMGVDTCHEAMDLKFMALELGWGSLQGDPIQGFHKGLNKLTWSYGC